MTTEKSGAPLGRKRAQLDPESLWNFYCKYKPSIAREIRETICLGLNELEELGSENIEIDIEPDPTYIAILDGHPHELAMVWKYEHNRQATGRGTLSYLRTPDGNRWFWHPTKTNRGPHFQNP